MLADGVALRNRCPQGQADPRAAIAGGASGVTMARAGPHPRRARSMRWADVYVPHVPTSPRRRCPRRRWRWADVYVSGLGPLAAPHAIAASGDTERLAREPASARNESLAM